MHEPSYFAPDYYGHDVLKESGKYPCGVGNNSIHCSRCTLCVHKNCSGITKRLVADSNHICPRCKGESLPIDGQTVTEVDVNSNMLHAEAPFCYVGDMLCPGGGWDSVIAARCCGAWGKFRKLLPVLTTRHLSPRIHGEVYKTCVFLANIYHGA